MKEICLQVYEEYENGFDEFLIEMGFSIFMYREISNLIVKEVMRKKQKVAIKFYPEDLRELGDATLGIITYVLCIK